jgi:hypothetical protein
MRNWTLTLVIVTIMTVGLGGCSTAAPSETTSKVIATTTTAALPTLEPPTSSPTSSSTIAGGEADPCQLVTQAEAEVLAGDTVTVKTGVLPGPPGEGAFCLFTNANLEELEIRTAVGRGDYDNDRKLATGNEWNVVDVPSLGDEAWSDHSPLLASINTIAHGAWVRISASNGFGSDPAAALSRLAVGAVERLP